MPPTEVDPSTLTPQELSKMNKKDIAKHLGTLQEMFAERGKKYEKAKSIIHKNKSTKAIQAKSTNNKLIPKPHGRRSRNFNIFEEMKAEGEVEINKETYNKLINSIHLAVGLSKLDLDLPLNNQDISEVAKVFAYITEEYPFIARYRNAWPVRQLMLQFMGNTRNNNRAKANASNNGQAPQDPGPSNKGNGDDGKGGSEPDVDISDISDIGE